jgi:hypothetical protein
VLALGVVDQRHRGPGQVGQVGDLAGMVHAQLDHADLVRGLQPQQSQRHADVVVQIAFGGQGALGLPGPQDGRDHLGDGGLAVAAGHADQGQAALRAPGCGQCAQRSQAVGHLDAR